MYVISVLKRTLNKYEEICNTLECDLDNEDYVLYKFDSILDRLNKIANKYDVLPDISLYEKNTVIIDDKIQIRNEINNIKSMKEKTKNKYKQIPNIEKGLINGIKNNSDITVKTKLNYSDAITDPNGNFYFRVNEIRVSNKKLKVYFHDQNNLIKKINSTFAELSKCYKSDTFHKVSKSFNLFTSKLKLVSENYYRFYKRLNDYCIDTEMVVKQNISNIERSW